MLSFENSTGKLRNTVTVEKQGKAHRCFCKTCEESPYTEVSLGLNVSAIAPSSKASFRDSLAQAEQVSVCKDVAGKQSESRCATVTYNTYEGRQSQREVLGHLSNRKALGGK